jgi:hypothetical protein
MIFENFIKLGKDIYVYKNFLSQDECRDIVDLLEKIKEENWIKENNFFRTEPLAEIISIRNKINELIPNGLYLGKASTATRLLKGDFWGEHADVHDFLETEKLYNLYIEGMPYKELDLSIYGTVLYFNKFEGGEIYYPTQNIIYSPNPGDLVIHGSSSECLHGVKTLISEKRYSYANHIYKKVKVPL